MYIKKAKRLVKKTSEVITRLKTEQIWSVYRYLYKYRSDETVRKITKKSQKRALGNSINFRVLVFIGFRRLLWHGGGCGRDVKVIWIASVPGASEERLHGDREKREICYQSAVGGISGKFLLQNNAAFGYLKKQVYRIYLRRYVTKKPCRLCFGYYLCVFDYQSFGLKTMCQNQI